MSEAAASPSPPAHTKATREDWLKAALDTLIADGADSVKVLNLANRLGVSRSSFYWYFKDRDELLSALLAHWRDTNTLAILNQAAAPSSSIVEGVANLFRCWVDDRLFWPRLDFAVREWSRRSEDVRRLLDEADRERVEAIAGLFRRHGFAETDAFVRARVLYFMQIGYYALDLNEPMDDRRAFSPYYVKCFTGQWPEAGEMADLDAFLDSTAR